MISDIPLNTPVMIAMFGQGAQTDAYTLARDRRDALTREFHFLPPELIARTTSAGSGRP